MVELREQLGIAGDVAGVEQRGADGGVGGAVAEAFVDRTRRMPDLQSQVPQEIQHVLDHLQGMRGRVVRGKKQQVDVAERCQRAASVATGGGDGQRFGLPKHARGVFEQRRDQPIDQARQQPSCLQAGEFVLLELVCTWVWMRARWRRKAARAASRGGARSPPRAFNASASTAAAAAGFCGRGVGVSMSRTVLCRVRAENRQHGFQAIKRIQRLARGEAVRVQFGQCGSDRIRLHRRWRGLILR